MLVSGYDASQSRAGGVVGREGCSAIGLVSAWVGVPGVSWTVVKNLSLFEHVR